MINVAAIRMQQFGVQFYQASLTAEDIAGFGVALMAEASSDLGLRARHDAGMRTN